MNCVSLDFNVDPMLIYFFFVNLIQKMSKHYKLQILGLFLNLYKTKQKNGRFTHLKAFTLELSQIDMLPSTIQH